MAAPLDLDQLRTFVAIAESGSFTRAADAVSKTQSAVSMQMRRLEERIGKSIFTRDGRTAKLTSDGERLLGYARRMVRLSEETLSAFDDTGLSGSIRLGTIDDYADRFLPEILARFARSNPRVEVSVVCEPSLILKEMVQKGDVDLAIVTTGGDRSAKIVRREPLLWVTSHSHAVELEDVLPLALCKPPCTWRSAALDSLASVGRSYRVRYSNGNSTMVAAAVQAGLAISVLAESALRPGMRILTEADGFPRLPWCEIGIIRSWNRPTSAAVDKLIEHVTSSLDNLTHQAPIQEPGRETAKPRGGKSRMRTGLAEAFPAE
jgi:DNA-binding transcriptional LysR family regulator